MPEVREIFISNGADIAGYMWLHAYDRLLQNIASDVVHFGLVPTTESADTTPSTWVAFNGGFDVRDSSVPIGQLRVGFFIGTTGHYTGDGIVPGEFRAWLKVADNPEVELVNCGRIKFT